MWPSILVPIVLFFGLTVFVSGSISENGIKSLQKK